MTDIIIDPVTRISGNARVRVYLDEEESLQRVDFQAFGYRGFDQIAEGAHIDNLLSIVSRICGGDSLFHQMAAASAVEKAVGYTPPEGAIRLRELAMWAQLFERHAVSLTMHSLPDLLFPSSDPGVRNIISIYRVDEEVVRRVLNLKSLGTAVLREAGGAPVHAVNFVPGGAIKDLTEERKKSLIKRLTDAKPLLVETGRLIKLLLRRNEEAVNTLGINPTSYLSIKGEEGIVLMGDRLEAVGPEGESLGVLQPAETAARVSEKDKATSHIKGVTLSEIGEVRVGPLARLNINRRYGTQLADTELEEIKTHWGFPLHHSMISHAARIIEMIHAWEKMIEILGRPPGEVTRRELPLTAGTGVAVVEGPEGIFIYRLVLNQEGLVEELNITSPLQLNLGVMEGSLEESARNLLGGAEPGERTRNRLEMAVRAYAPCILCGVH
jgi:coenzyme F420-reducing hydrogenase alpha subunit